MTTDTIEKALESVASAHTWRMYERALKRFAQWLDGRELSYPIAREYKAEMVQAGFSPQNINAHLSAIRFYVRELAKAGEMAIEKAESICQVEGAKVKGRKLGNWLSIEEAEKLLNAPDVSNPLGLRDRAILALLVGAGLRRSEVVGLQVKHFERRSVTDENGHSAKRWMLVGVTGKHGRTRNIGSVAKIGCGRKKPGPDSSLGGNLEEALHESNLSANVAFPDSFNLSLPNHIRDLISADGPPRRLEAEEAESGIDSAFYESVILLDDIIKVLAFA